MTGNPDDLNEVEVVDDQDMVDACNNVRDDVLEVDVGIHDVFEISVSCEVAVDVEDL